MKKLKVRFKDDNYLDFISHCFVNVLIKSVSVDIEQVIPNSISLLTIELAAPGIDRINKAIDKYNGTIV